MDPVLWEAGENVYGIAAGAGNPVRIGDGCATVRGYELSSCHWQESGKAKARFETPSQDIRSVALIRFRQEPLLRLREG